MQVLHLYLWEFAVAICIFGWGAAGLRILRFNRPPLALAGSFGIALLIALGGWMNLLHLLSPAAIYGLVGVGVLLAAYTGFRSIGRVAGSTQAEPWDLPSRIVVGTAILVLAVLLFGTLRPVAWSQDDLHGYAASAKKTLDNHSVQSDPFSERRIVSGLGGGIFLDTLMLPEGDFRAIKFIDESFGLFLYALSLWTIGRMWKAPRWAVALGLIGIPVATLIQANLSIVYLTSAACLAILIALSHASTAEGVGAGETFAAGILMGALLTTKSSNFVFVLPFWFLTFVLFKLLAQRARVLLPGVASLLIAVFVALPWAIAQKANEGTYLYPLFGKGFHSSAYHILPDPSSAGSLTTAAIVAVPGLLMMLGCLLAAWMLTRRWAAWTRASVIGFAAAAALTVPAMAISTGGEAVDRYTAPFIMPMVLMLLFLVLQPRRDRNLNLARCVGAWVLAFSGFYIIHFIGFKLEFYKLERVLLFEALGRVPQRRIPGWILVVDPSYLQQEQQRDLQSQAALPVGATAIEVVRSPFGFDFRRNRIYICDECGMAGLPPGMPIDLGPDALRKYLVGAGVSYIIYDRRDRGVPHPAWEEFVRQPHIDYSARELIHDQIGAHNRGMWGRMETYVTWHVMDLFYDIANTSPVVYDDGTLVVARIGAPD